MFRGGLVAEKHLRTVKRHQTTKEKPNWRNDVNMFNMWRMEKWTIVTRDTEEFWILMDVVDQIGAAAFLRA